MRYQEITELAGVKQFANMTASEVIQFIEAKLGKGPIKILGQGANGAAVQIGSNVYKFWMIDSAYTDYVKHCLRNKGNPFLPVFLSDIKKIPAFFIRHEDAPDYVNYVKMEKLTNVGSDAMNHLFYLDVKFDDEDHEDEMGHVAVANLGQIAAFVENTPATEVPPITQFIKSFSQYKSFQYTREMLPDDLVQLITTLFELKHLREHRLDLHSGNFMMRGDQLVIIDPIANNADLNVNRSFQKFDEKLWRDDSEGKKAQSAATRRSNATKQASLKGQDDNQV